MCVYDSNMKFSGNTYYDFFDYKGKRYHFDAKIFIKNDYYDTFYDVKDKETFILDHYKNKIGNHCYIVFRKYGTGGEVLAYQIYKNPDEWIESVEELPYEVQIEKKTRKHKDSENGDVMFGWLLYVITMAVLTIFNDRIIGWIVVSAYFFWWRNKKLAA